MKLDFLSFPANTEQFTTHKDCITNFECIEYYYRNEQGKMFSCTGLTIEDCRLQKDNWLKEEEKKLQKYIKLLKDKIK